jgi:enoyl-CoA hydratase
MLDIEDHDGVSVVRLRHGKVNALDLELVLAVTAAVRDVESGRALVITGAGSAFSAGVDLRRLGSGGSEYAREFLPALSGMFLAIFDHPGPALAAVNGHAIAGGCVMAAACDVRVMAAGTIGLTEVSAGVPLPPAALEIMRHAVGPKLGELVLTAAPLDAAAARSAGLIHAVEAPEALLDSVIARARAMLRLPAEVFAFSKRQLQRPARERIAAAGADADAVQAMWESPLTQKAVTAYLDALGSAKPRLAEG